MHCWTGWKIGLRETSGVEQSQIKSPMSGMEKAHAAGQAGQKLATLKLTAEKVPRVSTQNFNINN